MNQPCLSCINYSTLELTQKQKKKNSHASHSLRLRTKVVHQCPKRGQCDNQIQFFLAGKQGSEHYPKKCWLLAPRCRTDDDRCPRIARKEVQLHVRVHGRANVLTVKIHGKKDVIEKPRVVDHLMSTLDLGVIIVHWCLL